jgi:hypothetical protein
VGNVREDIDVQVDTQSCLDEDVVNLRFEVGVQNTGKRSTEEFNSVLVRTS